jgi:hypothetical protein
MKGFNCNEGDDLLFWGHTRFSGLSLGSIHVVNSLDHVVLLLRRNVTSCIFSWMSAGYQSTALGLVRRMIRPRQERLESRKSSRRSRTMSAASTSPSASRKRLRPVNSKPARQKSNSTHRYFFHIFPYPVPASHIPTPATVRRLQMSNRPSRPARSARQPFRLLDLPRELLVPIVRSYRTPIFESVDGVVIYMGEGDRERYRVLLDLCLTHRDILPFAQKELFKRLDIRSDEGMDMLNRSIASSERCKEYAGRTESIFVGWDVNADKLMESGAFNPRELYGCSPMMFFILSRSCPAHIPSPTLTLILSIRSLSKPSSHPSQRGTIRSSTRTSQSRDILFSPIVFHQY